LTIDWPPLWLQLCPLPEGLKTGKMGDGGIQPLRLAFDQAQGSLRAGSGPEALSEAEALRARWAWCWKRYANTQVRPIPRGKQSPEPEGMAGLAWNRRWAIKKPSYGPLQRGRNKGVRRGIGQSAVSKAVRTDRWESGARMRPWIEPCEKWITG